MKGDADQLIAEATNLLREIMRSGRKAVGEIDSKSMSPEQRFWFKLAESVARRSESIDRSIDTQWDTSSH